MYGGGDAQAPGLGQLLDALREDDARTGDRVIGNDYLTECDPDPDLWSDLIGEQGVLFRIGDLKRQARHYAI